MIVDISVVVNFCGLVSVCFGVVSFLRIVRMVLCLICIGGVVVFIRFLMIVMMFGSGK